MATLNKNSINYTLILVSAIDPKGVAHTARSSISDRLNDTVVSLNKWIKSSLFNKIIFIDNSGYPLDFIKKLEIPDDLHLEIHSVDLQDFDRSWGKGYGVYRSVSYVLENSILFSNNDYIALVGARYYIKNTRQILSRVHADIVCNLTLNLSFAFDPLFIARGSFFRYTWEDFLSHSREDPNIYKTLDGPKVSYEHNLARAVHFAISQGYSWSLPSRYPYISAVSGSTNIKYSTGLKFYIYNFYFAIKNILFRFVR